MCSLPTIIVVHPRENRAKCSIEPLRGRSDLRFVNFSPRLTLDLQNYIRLAVDGPPLGESDATCGILLLDGTWRHAERMETHFRHVPPRSLAGFHTAYPRVSKLFRDPSGGLASAEALYIAYRLTRRPSDGLLDAYHWRDRFLELNGWSERRGDVRAPAEGSARSLTTPAPAGGQCT